MKTTIRQLDKYIATPHPTRCWLAVESQLIREIVPKGIHPAILEHGQIRFILHIMELVGARRPVFITKVDGKLRLWTERGKLVFDYFINEKAYSGEDDVEATYAFSVDSLLNGINNVYCVAVGLYLEGRTLIICGVTGLWAKTIPGEINKEIIPQFLPATMHLPVYRLNNEEVYKELFGIDRNAKYLVLKSAGEKSTLSVKGRKYKPNAETFTIPEPSVVEVLSLLASMHIGFPRMQVTLQDDCLSVAVGDFRFYIGA